MSRNLQFAKESPTEIKHNDTTTTMKINLTEDGSTVDLTTYVSAEVHIRRESDKEIKNVPVSFPIPPELEGEDVYATPSQIPILFDSSFTSFLNVGFYDIEVWLTSSTGVAIFPGDKFITFQITESFDV